MNKIFLKEYKLLFTIIIMLPEIDKIKIIRKNFDLTQKDLAASIGVSQSIIAKIESKKVNPSYDLVKKIFNFFDGLEKTNESKAKDIMSKKIIKIGKDDKISKAIELMKRYGFSQLPVFSGGHSVGSITEAIVVRLISSGEALNKIMEIKIEDVMEESFPVVNEETPISSISALLQHISAVVVNRKAKASGIITKSDLLKTR